MSVFPGSLEHVLALFGWEDLVGSGLDLISNSSRGVMNLVSKVVDHVASGLEDGGHGEGDE
jgi:hypothetical protein